jgi:hypothetical protein
MNEAASNWKLDKHVPVAFIAALILNVGTSIWYASKLDSRVTQLEQWRADNRGNAELLIRIDERLAQLTRDINELKTKDKP